MTQQSKHVIARFRQLWLNFNRKRNLTGKVIVGRPSENGEVHVGPEASLWQSKLPRLDVPEHSARAFQMVDGLPEPQAIRL